MDLDSHYSTKSCHECIKAKEDAKVKEVRGKVSGAKSDHKVFLFALSTCGWCRRTKKYLEDKGITFDFVYVDLLAGDEREETVSEVRKWNPRASFPTIVVDSERAIVGFRQDEIEEALDL